MDLPGLTIRNLRYEDKIPNKYIIAWTYQMIFGRNIIIIILLDTIYVAMHSTYEGTCCPVTSATGWKFM